MELKDTIAGMKSEDYKQRFVAEYRQTKIRYEKLKAFCNKIEAAELMGTAPPKHDCPLYLLQSQQRNMEMYLHDLEIRAVIEDVKL